MSDQQSVKRRPKIAVGDLIQYRYSYGTAGTTSSAMTMRTVLEVIDDGARFKVEGGFYVFAGQVTVHIPMGPAAKPSGEEGNG